MSETYQFRIPYLEAAQAQKHVTVNEALTRLDALTQLRVQSRVSDVPATSDDGQTYIVPASATGAWLGQDHNIAIYSNGGWIFAQSQHGWVAWILDETVEVRFDGVLWDYAYPNQNPVLGAIALRTHEFDHTISAGTFNLTTEVIPSHSVVFGISGRVIEAVTGPVTLKFGVTGAIGRYGKEYGPALNSYVLGLTSNPITYFEDTALRVTGEGSDLIAGQIRLCIHYAQLTPPAAVL